MIAVGAGFLPPNSETRLANGDLLRVILRSGGYGDPRSRDPAPVQRDVDAGVVSLEVARALHGR